MKSAPFVRHVPRTVEEATAMLAEFGPQDGRVLAGGQSLVPIMAFRMARPAHLVDINEIAELAQMSRIGDTLSIGATVRHAAFHRPAVERADGPAACRRSCATSRIIRSAPAARSAAASRTPIQPRNGAWWPRRSPRRWSRRASAGSASSRQTIFSRHHDDGA